MKGKGKRRCAELFKTALIAALVISAVFLVGRLRLYTQISASPGWADNILSTLFHIDVSPDEWKERTGPGGSLCPVAVAVYHENGRWGLHYRSETLSAVFETRLGALLGEALAEAGESRVVSEEEWRQALCAQGTSIYYDFLGAVPLSSLAGWLGGEHNDGLAGEARRLILASDGKGNARLYYCGEDGAPYYAYEVSAETETRLKAVAAEFSPNNAVFAFEQEERYPGLDPYVMILPDPPSPVVYDASNPIGTEGGSTLDTLLRGLSFQPQTSAVYEAADGRVVREGKDTLRIAADGTVTFHASDSQEPRYPVGTAGEAPTRSELVDAAKTLVENGLGPWCGDAEFYLIRVENEPEGALAVSFGYLLDGAAVEVGRDGYAARVVFGDRYISHYTIRLRAYHKTELPSPVLPEAQAAAAMNALDAEGGELLLCYPDVGAAQIKACWVAR